MTSGLFTRNEYVLPCIMPPAPRPVLDRIFARTLVADCWLWQGSVTHGGYAKVSVSRKEWRLGHRIVWQEMVGPIPEHLVIDHLCRVRNCLNPDHMELVTPGENVRRGRNQYFKKSHCANGHEFTLENTYIRQNKPNWRYCRTCNRIAQKKYQEKRKE